MRHPIVPPNNVLGSSDGSGKPIKTLLVILTKHIKFLSLESAEKFGCTNCTCYHVLRGLQMASQYCTPWFLLIAQRGQQHCEGFIMNL